MKALIIAIIFLALSSSSFAQTKVVTHPKPKVVIDKYHDNIDNRMKGPKGEVIYIGSGGGRYYLKNNKKIYVEYKGNKKK